VLWRPLLHSPSTGEFNCQLISYLTKRASKRPAALHHVTNAAIELLIALILNPVGQFLSQVSYSATKFPVALPAKVAVCSEHIFSIGQWSRWAGILA